MESEEHKQPKAKPKGRVRKWLRRIAIGFCILVVLLIASLRPLLFYGGHYVVTSIVAKKANLQIEYEIGGTLFSSIRITNVVFKTRPPTAPVSVQAGRIDLEYSIPGLIREGLAGFFKTVDIENISADLTLPPAAPPPPKKPSGPVVIPPLFPQTLVIRNVNVTIHEPAGDLKADGFTFTLFPDKPGELTVQELDIPGVHQWKGISGSTTYGKRDLGIADLTIDRDISVKRLNLNASAIEQSRLGFRMQASLFGSSVSATAQLADLGKSNSIQAGVDISGLSLEPVVQYLSLTLPVRATLGTASVRFTGEPDKPANWQGSLLAAVNGLEYNHQPLGYVKAKITLAGGKADASVTSRPGSGNSLQIGAHADLPAKIANFARTSASGTIKANLPDISLFSGIANSKLSGEAALDTSFALNDRKLTTDTRISSSGLAVANAGITGALFQIHLEGTIPNSPKASPLDGLVLRLGGEVYGPRVQDYTADTLKLDVDAHEAAIRLDDLSLVRGKNTVTLSGQYTIPKDFRSWEKQPMRLDLGVAIPDFGAFSTGAKLAGSLQIDGHFSGEPADPAGNVQVTGRAIQAQGLTVRSVDAQLTAGDHHVTLQQLSVVLDDRNGLKVTGDAGITAPFAYKGALDVALNDLSVFQPLLRSATAPKIGGTLTASWSGDGNVSEMKHTGRVALDFAKGKYATLDNLSAHVAGGYSATDIDLPGISLVAGKLGDASLGIALHNKRLVISGIAIHQQKLSLLEGSIDLPCDLTQTQHPNLILGTDQPLSIDLQTKDLSVGQLLVQAGQKKPPMTGVVNMKTTFNGSLDKLSGSVSLAATKLQSTTAEKFAPADVAVTLTVASNTLSIAGAVHQQLIQPLKILGALPFDTGKIIRAGKIDPATPLNLQVSLPKSSLEFLSSLAPALRQSRGTAEADIAVNGTIQKPKIAGSIDVALSTLRFANPMLPLVNNTSLRVSFTPDKIEIQRCAGVVGGGTFGAGGTINLTKPANPVFDLWAGTKEALAMQNDDLTARVSSNIRVTGPLSAGQVSGQVLITRTRFFKDIDILPIGLPGRPAPEPPPAPAVISFPTPPLRNWKFDVAIRTADPIVIQSNLARGTVTVDLHLGGTGLAPWVDGSARIVNLDASLPFSRLQISSGLIYFQRAEPFIPHINIHGTSTIRDYAVSVYIYGTASDPQAVFTSNPPLPQADVVSLIATGMTTSDLRGNPNALAGQAAILLFRKLYSTVFKSNHASDNNSLLSQVQIDLGSTDPRTGRQAVTLGIPLTSRIMLTGGLDVGGNFRGQLKYIIRFR